VRIATAASSRLTHDYHAIAMPQIGPGRASTSPDKSGGHEDSGLEQVTGDPADILTRISHQDAR